MKAQCTIVGEKCYFHTTKVSDITIVQCDVTIVATWLPLDVYITTLYSAANGRRVDTYNT